MKNFIILIMFVLLIGCGTQLDDVNSYEIQSRRLNDNNTYTYIFETEYSYANICITTENRYNVGDKIKLSIITDEEIKK